MPQHMFWAFMYWAKTGKRSWGYVWNKRDYRHALERYRNKQIIKTERNESGHHNIKEN